MGAGGRTHAPATRKSAETDNFKRAPHLKPPFTFGQLKKAIPPHCFQRSLIRSFSYLVHDFAIASIFLYIASNYINNLSAPLSFLAWPIYWALQGSVLMGVWVLAHECGHNAFSDYQWLDDTLGLVLHSFLLAPYFSWKYSHRRHHSNAASLERDENYVPKRKSDMESYFKYRHNLPGRVLGLAVTLILGWYMYLAFNVYGRPYDGFACHFHPYSPIYSDRERLQIYISDAGVLAVCYGLYRLAVAKGLAWVLCFYGGPLMVVNSFLVLITYLHHIHPSLPHYDSSEWDWLRGALSTVDRDYGILTKVFHNITDTHVAHHLFSSIPHYHAIEATNAIKPILGDYYQFDATPFYKAIWREAKECIYVEPDEVDKKGVYWYKNKP